MKNSDSTNAIPYSGGLRRGKAMQVQNKAPAPVQITAEQILREAQEYKETTIEAPRQKVTDADELQEIRTRKRKEYEDAIRRSRENIGTWLRYAEWEASQNDFDRARSVYERALEIGPRDQKLWLKYAEFEMKSRFINHARNVWDRAVTLLPRVDQFWYKYAYMEEMLGNIGGARQIFERWMKWEPDYNAWNSYVKLEVRHKNPEKAREIFERFILCHPEPRTYLKYAKWEHHQGENNRARKIFERAVDELGEDAGEETYIAFAQFEEANREFDRARVIFKYALDHIPKEKAVSLYSTYSAFEKQHGSREGVEDVIISKKRFDYEEELKANPLNYDVWFDYIRLEEAHGAAAAIRDVYERAISQIPPVAEKKYWKRYIYLWINFALYEELEAKDFTRARQVLEKCIEIIPHKQFSFAKIWLMLAHFEVRRKNLEGARKVLGTAIGKSGKEKIFKAYIDLELQLGNVDRCRKLYEKYLEVMPSNCHAWAKFADLEVTFAPLRASLNESERARAIFELAINQPVLDMPEVLWKAYIDFEIKQKQYERVRALYKRLLQRTRHVKVWISRAQFEASVRQPQKAREVFEQADQHFKEQGNMKEERAVLLDSWRDFEQNFGNAASVKKVQEMMPQRVKRKRRIITPDGTEAGWEEYYDYIFPDETQKASHLKLLERAKAWKKQKMGGAANATASAGAGAASNSMASEAARTVEAHDGLTADGDENGAENND